MSVSQIVQSLEPLEIVQIAQSIVHGKVDQLRELTQKAPLDAYLYLPFGAPAQTALERAIRAQQVAVVDFLIHEKGLNVCEPIAINESFSAFSALELAKHLQTSLISLKKDDKIEESINNIVTLLTEESLHQRQITHQASLEAMGIWAQKRIPPSTRCPEEKLLPLDEMGTRFTLTQTLIMASLRTYEHQKARFLFKKAIAPNRRGLIAALRSLVLYWQKTEISSQAANTLVGAIIVARDNVDLSHAAKSFGYQNPSTFVTMLNHLLERLGIQNPEESLFKACFHHHFGPMPSPDIFL